MALGCIALAVSLAFVPKVHAASGGSSKTAQSVMVQTNLSNSAFEIVGDTTYHWDPQDSDLCAEGYYHAADGVWDQNTPDCNGNSTNCDPSNQPATPPAPAIDTNGPNSVGNHITQDRCTFFCGGTPDPWSYTQTVTVNGLNGHGNWTFTYNYNVTTDPTAAGTCWHCAQSGGTAEIAYCGFVAGESFLKKSRDNSGWTTKYSFSLADDLGASRVINTTATLQKSTDGGVTFFAVQGPVSLDTSMLVNCGAPTDSAAFCDQLGAPADYTYFGNGGVFGNSTVYNNLHAPGYLAGATTNFIMSNPPDDFPNNNNNLCGYSQTAPFHGSFTVTEDGTYQIVVAGTVKGNAAIGSQNFSVTSTGTVGGACVHVCPDNLPPCNP